MGNDEEGEVDVMVQTYHHSPHEVVEHGIVLVLPHTVVCMQVNICFSAVSAISVLDRKRLSLI